MNRDEVAALARGIVTVMAGGEILAAIGYAIGWHWAIAAYTALAIGIVAYDWRWFSARCSR